MLDITVFVVTLVVALVLSSLITSFIMWKVFMNKKTLMKYSKMYMDVAKELAGELFEEDEGL